MKKTVSALRTALSTLGLLASALTYAEGVTPLQLALWHPYQLVDDDVTVLGLRLALVEVGTSRVRVADVALGRCEADLVGVQVAGVRGATDSGAGLQFALGWSEAKGDFHGIQAAGLVSTMDSAASQTVGLLIGGLYCGSAPSALDGAAVQQHPDAEAEASVVGVQVAGVFSVIYGERPMRGVQIAGAGTYADCLRGVQIGALNSAVSLKGMQIGVVNFCEKFKGIQIGFLNIVSESKLPWLPLLRVRF